METNITIMDQCVIIQFSGELTSDSVSHVETIFTKYQEDHTRFVIDLSMTNFLGSSVLKALLSKHNELLQEGGAVSICSPNKVIKEVLEFSGFSNMIPIFIDLDSYLNQL